MPCKPNQDSLCPCKPEDFDMPYGEPEIIRLVLEAANDLRDRAFEEGKPRENGTRTRMTGLMDMIEPLIQEIARLRVEVNSLKNQPKE